MVDTYGLKSEDGTVENVLDVVVTRTIPAPKDYTLSELDENLVDLNNQLTRVQGQIAYVQSIRDNVAAEADKAVLMVVEK